MTLYKLCTCDYRDYIITRDAGCISMFGNTDDGESPKTPCMFDSKSSRYNDKVQVVRTILTLL